MILFSISNLCSMHRKLASTSLSDAPCFGSQPYPAASPALMSQHFLDQLPAQSPSCNLDSSLFLRTSHSNRIVLRYPSAPSTWPPSPSSIPCNASKLNAAPKPTCLNYSSPRPSSPASTTNPQNTNPTISSIPRPSPHGCHTLSPNYLILLIHYRRRADPRELKRPVPNRLVATAGR